MYTAITTDLVNQDYAADSINTHIISGQVTTNDQPLPGVVFNGFPGNEKPVTDVTGMYAVAVPEGWSGKVFTVLSGYTFTPDTVAFKAVNMAVTQNFQAFPPLTFTISGTVTNEAGIALDSILLNGFPAGPVYTDNIGAYAVEVPKGWSGTVSPVLENHIFTPEKYAYEDVSEAISNRDYRAIKVIAGLLPGASQKHLQAYPNPSHGQVSLSIEGHNFTKGHIDITNSTGVRIMRIPLQPAQHTYQLQPQQVSVLTAGMYQIMLFADNQLIEVSKLMILP